MASEANSQSAIHALFQLGFEEAFCYGLYQIGLKMGWYRRFLTPFSTSNATNSQIELSPGPTLVDFPKFTGIMWKSEMPGTLLAQADEISMGKVRLFGGAPVPLELVLPGPLAHWTKYETGKAWPGDQVDIKFTWEPARFGWAITLGRAYQITGNEDYAQAFWQHTETFLTNNPPYLGPNWISAQEVALRLIALVYAGQAVRKSVHTSPQRLAVLSQAIANHARRIPLTLVYARSQNNNHLLSEAAGLYTAGLALPGHPDAQRWRNLGWKWFNRGLQKQITPEGVYSQHSTNYLRLVLQLALWVDAIKECPLPPASQQRLAASVGWLESLLDASSGQVPNLGANDGAYLFPLGGNFSDYRTVIAQAREAFGPAESGPAGDNKNGLALSGKQISRQAEASVVIHHPDQPSWAYLRVAHFQGRPSHADQLHLDLWWQGLNLSLDAGTFQYNALPPWDNGLASTAVHNTIMLDGQEQMTRASRFLWLDWAQAEVIGRRTTPTGEPLRVDAGHDGYVRLGARHWRRVSLTRTGWLVTDDILPVHLENSAVEHTLRLHWLLPDWPWKIADLTLTLNSPKGPVKLTLSGGDSLTLIRGGEVMYGSGPTQPTWGWRSPTYGVKLPALALVVEKKGALPMTLVSEWNLDGQETSGLTANPR